MRTLLLFDGLGSSNGNLLRELRTQYAAPENSSYFQVIFDTLDEVAGHLVPPECAQPFPDGLTLRRWLDPECGATDDVLGNSVAAGLCVYAYQACQIQPARLRPDDGTVAALGYSIGLLAALLAGMRLRRMDEFLELVATGLRLAAVVLVRAQQVAGAPLSSGDVVDRYRRAAHKGAPPGPMASLAGLRRDRLNRLVDEFNQDGGAIALSLVNAPQAHVLSGSTADLLEFYFAHEDEFRQTGVTWAFLTNSIPFHSPQLAPAADLVNDDRGFIGPFPDGGSLRLSVYATDGPRDLRHSADLVDEFLQ